MFFSRKQQWRRACRASGAIRHDKKNATNGQPTPTKEVEERFKFRRQEQIQNLMGSPACNSRTTSTSWASPEKKPAAQMTPQHRTTTTRCATSESSSSSGGGAKIKAKRRVCFDSKIKVVLVPTRHELKSKSLAHNMMATEGGVKKEGYSNHDNGIWWTMRDCFEFRKAYRRQIIASGLKCKSLLCPTEIVFLIGAEDEEEKTNEELVSSSRASITPYQVSVVSVLLLRYILLLLLRVLLADPYVLKETGSVGSLLFPYSLKGNFFEIAYVRKTFRFRVLYIRAVRPRTLALMLPCGTYGRDYRKTPPSRYNTAHRPPREFVYRILETTQLIISIHSCK